VGFQGSFHDIHAAVEFTRFFVFGDLGADSSRGEESWDPGSSGAHALGECSLRHQIEFNLVLQNHLFQQFVFTNVSSDMFANLPRREQKAHAETVDADVVADGGEILHAFADEGANQVLRNTAESKAAKHYGGAVRNVADRLVGIGNDFVHVKKILNE